MFKSNLQKRCLFIGSIFIILSFILSLFIGCSHVPGHKWNKSQKNSAYFMVFGRGVDMYSTHDAISRGARETNPFLSDYPNDEEIAMWWVGSSLICLSISHVLPSFISLFRDDKLTEEEVTNIRNTFNYGMGGISIGVGIKNFLETR